jgi:hypothetical protein
MPDQYKIVNEDGDFLHLSGTGYALTSLENLEFFDTVDGSNINVNIWNQSTSTMTITQASSFININPTNSVTANAYAIASSVQNFFVTSCMPLHIHFTMQSSLWAMPDVNSILEFGWMTCATNAAPTDGVFVRCKKGVITLVNNFGGVEKSATLDLSAYPVAANVTNEFVLDVYADFARLYLVDANPLIKAALTVKMDPAQPALTTNNRQPVSFRVYNTATAPASSPTLKLGQISVQQRNANFSQSLAQKLSGFGRHALQSPVTAFGQTANMSNSAAPASATLSNATAGYTTLGGQFQFAAVAGAETDYALFAFQIPATFQLIIDKISISTFNMGAASATTPTLLQWSVGINSTAVDLSTADGAATKAARRMPLGVQSVPVAAAIGANVPDVIWDATDGELVVESGRYLHIILKMPVGTATGSQIIRGTVGIYGLFM